MSGTNIGPESFPESGEFETEAVTLETRAPQIFMPKDAMWPLRLHDEDTYAAASAVLPKLVVALSEPIKPVSQVKLHDLFATNPHDRRLPWTFKKDNDTCTFSAPAYEGPAEQNGSRKHYRGINYQFDSKGRMIKREYIESQGSYQSGQAIFQEFLTYDEDGYLTERTTWGYIDPTITDRFEYDEDQEGDIVPTKLTRTLKVQSDNHGYTDSNPITVDLANHEEWLATNPNGFMALAKEQLSPKELVITDFNVIEKREGILFAHPEQLEHALVMYGDGSYPTLGSETALEYNDKAIAEASGHINGAIFSLYARSADMNKFVKDRITNEVQEKWELVQKSPIKDISQNVYFHFDYDGAGHFHKSFGNIVITKNGLELTLSAAYVGDKVEDDLASALRVKRGLRSTAIEIPINQTEREGYFYIDIKKAAAKIGISVPTKAIIDYLREYTGKVDESPRQSFKRKYGEQPVIWKDEATDVSLDLIVNSYDYDSDTDLDAFFNHDGHALWGPLPREIRYLDSVDKNVPKLRVLVKPTGNPFDEETTKRTDDIVRSYMERLEELS